MPPARPAGGGQRGLSPVTELPVSTGAVVSQPPPSAWISATAAVCRSTCDLHQRAPRRQRRGLRRDDLGVADLPGLVAVEHLLLGQVGRVGGLLAQRLLLAPARARRRAGPRRPGRRSARSAGSAPRRRRARPRAPLDPGAGGAGVEQRSAPPTAPSDHSSVDALNRSPTRLRRCCRATRSGRGSGRRPTRSMPICALAGATTRARPTAMSGRRCSSVDGTPSGTAGTAGVPGRPRASAKSAGALPTSTAIACSSCARWRASAEQVGARVGQLRLRLQHVGARRDAGVVAVVRDLQRALVAGDACCRSRSRFGIGLAQREVVGRQLALRRQPRRRQVGRAGLRAGPRALDAAAQRGPTRRAPSSPPMPSW